MSPRRNQTLGKAASKFHLGVRHRLSTHNSIDRYSAAFRKTETPRNSSLLVGQTFRRVGFYKDGKLPPSVTHTISKEMDKAIFTKLLSTAKEIFSSTSTSISTQAEVVAFQNVDRFSTAFLISLPNRTGFFTDPFFADAMA